MSSLHRKYGALALVAIVAFTAGWGISDVYKSERVGAETGVVSLKKATTETFDWGTLNSYYVGESFGTKDLLVATAVIKPGMQIHPPHVHAEEEFMLVVEGQGTWEVLGKEFTANQGDIMYSIPWEIHGITNTGTEELTFLVFKWNNKGIPIPKQPEGK